MRPALRLLRREPQRQQRVATRRLCTAAASPNEPREGTAQQEPQHRTARSLRDVARGHAVHSLLLPSSRDLICKNMMCEHVGSSCACKLSLVLERLPQLQEMDLSNNKLRFLPESTFQLPHLTHLNVARNHLTTLSPSIQQLTSLTVLDLRDNRIAILPEAALLALPNLQEIHVAGNPQETIAAVQSEKLRAIMITTTAE